jgi:hypothetical protein
MVGTTVLWVQSVVPLVAVDCVPVEIQVISETIPKVDNGTVRRQPEFDAKSQKVWFTKGAEDLCIRRSDNAGLLSRHEGFW